MKRIRRAYSKTVSLIDETAVQIYQSFVGKKRDFFWKVMIRITDVTSLWERIQRKSLRVKKMAGY